MSTSGYEQVTQALEKLRYFASGERKYAPLLTRTKLACAVDTELNVHALRCALMPGDDRAVMRKLEYLVIRPGDSTPPAWQAYSNEIFNPAFPFLAARGDRWVGGVIGVSKDEPELVRLQAYQALIFSIENGTLQPVGTAFERVKNAARAAVGADGKIYLLAPKWFPPPTSPKSIPLVLASVSGGRSEIVADPVPGSDATSSFPTDAAIHLTGNNQIHLVYDGRQSGRESTGARLWHLVLEGGKRTSARDLGAAPRYPILSRIFASPEGRLYYLAVHSDEDNRERFEHRIIPLDAKDTEGGSAEHYFVDYWLQVHGVWCEGKECHYRGPDGIPQSR